MCFARDMPCGAIRINIISHVSAYIAFAEQKYRVCQRQTYRYNHKITIGTCSINFDLASCFKLRISIVKPCRGGYYPPAGGRLPPLRILSKVLYKPEFARNKTKRPPIARRPFLIGIKKRREVERKKGFAASPSF